MTKMVKISFGLVNYLLEDSLYNWYSFKDNGKMKLTT